MTTEKEMIGYLLLGNNLIDLANQLYARLSEQEKVEMVVDMKEMKDEFGTDYNEVYDSVFKNVT